MACLTTAQITQLKAEIAKLDTLIDAYEDELLAAASGSRIQEYRFDSGDGSQKVINYNPRMLNNLIEDLKSQRNRLQGKLSKTGLIAVNLRRRPY